jgi:hypothetical protein
MPPSFLRQQHLEQLRWRIRYVSHLLEVHHRSHDATSLRWLAQETIYLQHLQKAERELKEHTTAVMPSMEQAEILIASSCAR